LLICISLYVLSQLIWRSIDCKPPDCDDVISQDINTEAFITCIVGDTFVKGALVLKFSLDKIQTKRRVIALISSLSDDSIFLLKSVGYEIRHVEPLSTPTRFINTKNGERLKYSFTKLRVWEQYDISKAVYLDSDLVIIQGDVEKLFQWKELSVVLFRYKHAMHLNSGVMVLRPSPETFNRLLNFYHNENFAQVKNLIHLADQDLLNKFFEVSEKEPNINVHRLPSIFNVLNPRGTSFKREVIVHFAGPKKPWMFTQNGGESVKGRLWMHPVEKYWGKLYFEMIQHYQLGEYLKMPNIVD